MWLMAICVFHPKNVCALQTKLTTKYGDILAW